MDFLGRKSELETLEREYNKKNSTFVVIYGRRRVGKTTLIKEFIKDKTAFYFLATKEIESLSMKRFGKIISRETKNELAERANYSDWFDYFKLICDYKTRQKKIIIIDEFPYIVKNNNAFPSIIRNIWDELLSNNNVMLILCGSLISMMKKHTLSYESPLYGRRTSQIRLMPLSFCDIYNAENKKSFCEAVEEYAITGGVPKYIEFFDNNDSIYENIKNNILNTNGFLYEESNFLLENEVQTPNIYFSILKTISDGNHKLSKISSALSISATSLMPYLTTLFELGFIEKRTPITEIKPEKSKKGLYFISDNFIKFWFVYVYSFKGELELGNKQIVLEEIDKSFESTFIPFVFEEICKEIFAKKCQKKEINFVTSKIGSYWLNEYGISDSEIDIAAVDNTNKRLFLGECKYLNKPVKEEVYYSLLQKYESSKDLKKVFKDYKVLFGIFSKSGFSAKLKSLSKANKNLLLFKQDSLL